MKRILILGAAKNQLPLIYTAKELGYYIIVCDWTTTNPGIMIADKHYQVSITDPNICLEVAKKEFIDGVISNYEGAMSTVAYISECLGLVGNSFEGIKALSTKSNFRDLQHKCGLYAPKNISGSEFTDIVNKIKSFSYPVIVKPCESSATRGTTRIDSFDVSTLKASFDDCASMSRNKKACVEEFVEMPSLEVIDGDVFVYNDNYLWGGVFTSIRASYAPMIPTTQVYPIVLSNEKLNEVKNTIVSLFSEAGVRFGEFNIEMYYDKQGRLFIIEVNVRQGGNGIPLMIKAHTGIDYTKLLVSLSVKDENYWNEVIIQEPLNVPICRHPIYSPTMGMLKDVIILDPLKRKLKNIEYVKQKGEQVVLAKTALDVIAFATFEFSSYSEMLQYYNRIDDFCKVILE